MFALAKQSNKKIILFWIVLISLGVSMTSAIWMSPQETYTTLNIFGVNGNLPKNDYITISSGKDSTVSVAVLNKSSSYVTLKVTGTTWKFCPSPTLFFDAWPDRPEGTARQDVRPGFPDTTSTAITQDLTWTFEVQTLHADNYEYNCDVYFIYTHPRYQ